MEVVDNIQEHPHKFPRLAVESSSNKIGLKGVDNLLGLEDGESKRVAGNAAGGVDDGGDNRLRGWHHSRIIRVSRASGGKDRHSKVWTSKGLRDRRVRLSVATAIQFYDLQDRLGFEQPSKAVEWLIKAAADAIAELPSLNTSCFPETPKGEKVNNFEARAYDSAELNVVSLSKSACSSNSETSKGSGLSLSRSEVRVNRLKARERARDRAQKEKEKEKEKEQDSNLNSITQNSSFTELLAGTTVERQWQSSTVPMDYFSSGILEPSPSRTHQSSGFSEQIHLGSSMSSSTPLFGVSAGDNHHFSFVPDGGNGGDGGGGDYNLNFTISSGLPGFHRGTLQSNSSSPSSLLPHHHHRFSPVDGSNSPFFFGGGSTVAATSTAPPVLENHHHYQFSPVFDGRLQLCYGGGSRQTEQKGKEKN